MYYGFSRFKFIIYIFVIGEVDLSKGELFFVLSSFCYSYSSFCKGEVRFWIDFEVLVGELKVDGKLFIL